MSGEEFGISRETVLTTDSIDLEAQSIGYRMREPLGERQRTGDIALRRLAVHTGD
ncbi:MAG: hypothetical protein JOZ32_08060 [Bryobacterales bacterium]|nr:hypothetical protein [Bryobacterales bacterium]